MSDTPPDVKSAEPPREFPIEVVVNGIKVTVTLLLRPGTAVSVKPDAD
jgi:hypothetical protein